MTHAEALKQSKCFRICHTFTTASTDTSHIIYTPLVVWVAAELEQRAL